MQLHLDDSKMDDDPMGGGFPAEHVEVSKSPIKGDARINVFVLWEPEGGSGFHPRKVPLDERKKKIGRSQPKILPKSSNVIFQNKVLSRNHAELWCENGKVWIRDVGSANGTTVNGVRLSGPGEESGPLEVQTGDTVRLGEDMLDQNGDATYKCIRARITLCDPATGHVIANTRLAEVDVHALYVPEVSHGRQAARNMELSSGSMDLESSPTPLEDQIKLLQRELDGMVAENRRLREAMTKAAEQRLARNQAQLQSGFGSDADENRQKELYGLYESIKHNGLEADGVAVQMMELTEILADMEDRAQGDIKGIMGAQKLHLRKQSPHAPSTPNQINGSAVVGDVDRQLLAAAEGRVNDLRKNVEELEAAVAAEAAQAKDIDMELQRASGERQALEQRVLDVCNPQPGGQAQDLGQRLAMLEEEANRVQGAVARAKELLDRLQHEPATKSPASTSSSQSAPNPPPTQQQQEANTNANTNINTNINSEKPPSTTITTTTTTTNSGAAQAQEATGKTTPPNSTPSTASLNSAQPNSGHPSTSPQGKPLSAVPPQHTSTDEKRTQTSQTATPSPQSANLQQQQQPPQSSQQQKTETPPPSSAPTPGQPTAQNKTPLFSSLDNIQRVKKEEVNEEHEEARDTLGKGGPSTSPPAIRLRSGDQSPLPTAQDDSAAREGGGSLGKAASAALLRKSQSAKSPVKSRSIKKSPSSRSAQAPTQHESTDQQQTQGEGHKAPLNRKGSEHKKGMCAVM